MSHTGPHNYKIEYFEPGIEKGTCRVPGCGAVKYFPTSPGKSTLNRANKLNAQAGVITNFKKSDYYRRTDVNKEELKMKNENTTQAQELPPVPPRPDISGMSKGQLRPVMHDYYMSNKEAILATVKLIGSAAARKRWGIPLSSWSYLMKRWGIPNERERRRAPGEKPLSEMTPREKVPAGVAAGEAAPMAEPSAIPKNLPDFPAFDKDWSFLVQIAWLETYRELAGK